MQEKKPRANPCIWTPWGQISWVKCPVLKLQQTRKGLYCRSPSTGGRTVQTKRWWLSSPLVCASIGNAWLCYRKNSSPLGAFRPRSRCCQLMRFSQLTVGARWRSGARWWDEPAERDGASWRNGTRWWGGVSNEAAPTDTALPVEGVLSADEVMSANFWF